ncbi:MAG: Rrf2 family transcriptional regulator [Clostridia bacterium]|jgi:Rrf2 family protein|nr:Rrf2 family transcriptional regulator [Clostridia bacterium]MBQ5801550.1 Rrf2 family transcriptional regulator [Clostridia bacterium]
MKLSQQTHNGLKIAYELGTVFPQEISSSRLAEKLFLSQKYLEKILRPLLKRGVVKASRGVNGGYRLALAPTEVTAGDVVRALEDDMEIIGCVKMPCTACPTSAVWRKLYDGINQVLDGITISQMIEEHEQQKANCHKDTNHASNISGSCSNNETETGSAE